MQKDSGANVTDFEGGNMNHQCLHCGLEIGQSPNLPDCSHTESSIAEARSEARWAEHYFQEKEQLQSQLSLCVQALEFYAHPDHYEERVTLSGTRKPGVLTEGGEKARACLAKLRNAEGGKE